MTTTPRRPLFFRFLTIMGGITLVFMLLIAIGLIVRCTTREKVPKQTILELDLSQELVEYIPDDPLTKAFAFRNAQSLEAIVSALQKAGTDPRVSGLVAYLDGGNKQGLAMIQELRDAIAEFRAQGKFAVAFAETFGASVSGNQGYYLATAFDEIWLQPSGDLGLVGLRAEVMFLRNLFNKLDVELRLDSRYEYKNALNMYTETGFTAAHRQALEQILQSTFGQIVQSIASARGLEQQAVRELIDQGPFSAAEALKYGLVDKLGYRDECLVAVRERAHDGNNLLFAKEYIRRAGHPYQHGERIAVIYGVGAVVQGPSNFDPLFALPTMGSETVAGALRMAIQDPAVKAIIFRVNSPGGSYIASDTIWRETVRAKEAGKPVIVSMSDVAGSGGYFVTMDATKIVAQPGTITGSIGVLGGKILIRNLFEKLGITWDFVQTSANAGMWSLMEDYTPHGWQQFQASLDRVYDDFVTKVANGRQLSRSRVHEIAKGRIWTGEDAKRLGLVDELGGYTTAIRIAKEAAGIDAKAPVELKVYPPPRSFLEKLLKPERENSESPVDVQTTIQLMQELEPIAHKLRALGFGPGSQGELAMPGMYHLDPR